MNSFERLSAALSGQPTDRLPFSPFLAYVWESYPQAVQRRGQLAFLQDVGADPLWRGAPCAVQARCQGITTRTREAGPQLWVETETPVGVLRRGYLHSGAGNTRFLVEHPLKTRADLQTQLWIEEHTTFEVDMAPVRAHLVGQGREGLSLGMLIPRFKSAFQTLVEELVGTQELAYALQDYPAEVDALWAAMLANDLQAAKLSLEAPYEYFLTWEDSGTQNYSPRLYDRYIGSEIAQWCSLLAEADRRYLQHACGHVRALVGRMAAHGAYGIESVSPPPTGNVSMAEARQLGGPDFAIIGGIEPTMLLNLSLAELPAYVEQVIAEGEGGPFVLANSDSCPPGVGVDKWRLIAEIARARHG